jgi:hypothetical protein
VGEEDGRVFSSFITNHMGTKIAELGGRRGVIVATVI